MFERTQGKDTHSYPPTQPHPAHPTQVSSSTPPLPPTHPDPQPTPTATPHIPHPSHPPSPLTPTPTPTPNLTPPPPTLSTASPWSYPMIESWVRLSVVNTKAHHHSGKPQRQSANPPHREMWMGEPREERVGLFVVSLTQRRERESGCVRFFTRPTAPCIDALLFVFCLALRTACPSKTQQDAPMQVFFSAAPTYRRTPTLP